MIKSLSDFLRQFKAPESPLKKPKPHVLVMRFVVAFLLVITLFYALANTHIASGDPTALLYTTAAFTVLWLFLEQ